MAADKKKPLSDGEEVLSSTKPEVQQVLSCSVTHCRTHLLGCRSANPITSV